MKNFNFDDIPFDSVNPLSPTPSNQPSLQLMEVAALPEVDAELQKALHANALLLKMLNEEGECSLSSEDLYGTGLLELLTSKDPE